MGADVRDIQYSDTGDITGFVSSGALSGSKEATFSGSIGQAAYTMGDVVGALKQVGILKE